jgi:hypothetical protein
MEFAEKGLRCTCHTGSGCHAIVKKLADGVQMQ